MHPTIRRTLLGIAVVATASLPLACSDDDETTSTAEPIAVTDTTTAPGAGDAASDDGSPEPGVVEVTLGDYAFLDLPAEVEAGTRLRVVNEGGELHELVAFRLPDDETRSVEELLAVPQEELMPLLGEPATVLLAAPGGPQIPAVGDGTLEDPGRYAILCFIPTGVDADAYLAAAASSDGPPQVPGGPPHVVHGMHAELVVR